MAHATAPTPHLDPTQSDDAIVALEAVYRNLEWSSFFTPVFEAERTQGRLIQDNGFMSTTLIKDSYGADMSVKSTIGNVGDAKVIQALSVYPSENEALLDHMGFVRVAFRLAFWHLLHTDDVTTALVDVVNRGGDSDTNGAIVGALLGAAHGAQALPTPWVDRVLDVRPPAPWDGAYHPRTLLRLVHPG